MRTHFYNIGWNATICLAMFSAIMALKVELENTQSTIRSLFLPRMPITKLMSDLTHILSPKLLNYVKQRHAHW